MRIRYALAGLAPALLALGVAVGCSKPTASTTQTSTAATTPAEAKVELTAVSAAEFEQAIRGLQGKVVLVDAWFLG